MSLFDARNLSLVMDLYEMTMANGYASDNTQNDWACFDVFYRHNPDKGGFAIFAGLEQVVDFLENMHFAEDDIAYLRSLNMFPESFLEKLASFRFSGDIDAFPEGTIMYPYEPMLTVHAPLMDAQLVETAILTELNHQSLIATKARRIVHGARGRLVADFGARRAHNMDAAIYGARAAYIGGVVSTATVLAGKMFGIPVTGTMAHSWVMYHKDEYTAFRRYAETYPDCAVLLVDTYNVLYSGIPNAIRVAKEVLEPMGKRLKGVRIDSGDLAYLSKRARAMLDEAGLNDCTIAVSNSLDEYTITSLIDQGGCIDSFGVGERLITAKSEPVFGAVYKMASVEHSDGTTEPVIKISETVEKITNPDRKRVFRVYNKDGHAIADLITRYTEEPDTSVSYRYVDPAKPWRSCSFEGVTLKELQKPVMRNGKRVADLPSLGEIRSYVARQLKEEIWEEEQRFENPHLHKLVMSPLYYETKMDLLYRHSEENKQRMKQEAE